MYTMNYVHTEPVSMAVLDARKVPPGQKADSDVIGTGEFPAGSSQMVKAIRQYQERGKVFVERAGKLCTERAERVKRIR
jgi:hypothetical protein